MGRRLSTALGTATIVMSWAVSCDPSSSPSVAEAEKAAAVTPEPESGPAPLVKARQAVTRHMPSHFASTHDLVDWIIDGDLEQAQTAAGDLANHRPKSMPADWFPYLERLRSAAADVKAATSLATAAAATARVTHACGSCHAGQGKGPKIPDVPPPAQTNDSCMLGHKWATERLWLGIVGPSDEAWAAGAKQFAATQACPDVLKDGPSHPDVFRTTAETLKAQAATATTATDLDSRARIYGELLNTCGSCHTSGC